MRNNKKPTGGQYYDDNYDSNHQKLNYLNNPTVHDINAFSKNETFDSNYNLGQKGKYKIQDRKVFNSKKNDMNFFEWKNNENNSSNVPIKSNNYNNQMGGFHTNRNQNQNQFAINYQQSSNKIYKNYKETENYLEDQFNQDYYYNNNQNNYKQFKNFVNKKNCPKNVSYTTLEKNIVFNMLVENPQVITNSATDGNYKQSLRITDKNLQIIKQSEEFNHNPDLNCKIKIDLSIKQEDKLKDNISVNNSIRIDSYNSVEDNTKTNTNSNTPVSASPILVCHKKSIISIKNEIKLNESRELNDKFYANFIGNLDNQEKKEELSNKDNYKCNHINSESKQSNLIQQKTNENVEINNLYVNDNKNKHSSQYKLSTNPIALNSFNNFNSNLIMDNYSNNSRSINSKNFTSSNKNKNLDFLPKNKFSQNSTKVINNNNLKPDINSFLQADTRYLNNNFNNHNKQFVSHHLPPNNNFPLFTYNIPNLILQNNVQFANPQNQFQPFPQNFSNRNFEIRDSKNSSNPAFFSNNSLNNNHLLNCKYVPNENSLIPNYNLEFISFPFNNNISPNDLFRSKVQNSHNLNNLNTSVNNFNPPNNFFNENYNRPIINGSININNTYSNNSSNNKKLNSFCNFPQKNNTVENQNYESNSNSAIVNNYFNYMFNDSNANNYIIGKEKKLDSIPPNATVILQDSLLKNKNENSIFNKVDIKDSIVKNSVADLSNENRVQNKSNIFQKTDNRPEFNNNNIDRSHAEDLKNTDKKQKQNQNPLKDIKEKSLLAFNSLENHNEKTNQFLKSKQNKRLDQNRNYIKDKNSISSLTENINSSSNENVEILKVVLMNVPGINSNDNNLTFIVHKLDNLFESFSSFLTLNKISIELEFSILVNIFQAISTIYSLNNSKISKSDEERIKILHSIWKNHCFLVSQKTLFNKENENSFTKRNIENDLFKILSLNTNKDLDGECPNDITYSNNMYERNLIENIGVYDSSFSFEDELDYIEEDFELDISTSFSCKGEYDCIDRMHYMNSISLLNKSF